MADAPVAGNPMTRSQTIHPDMQELIASKQAVEWTSNPDMLRKEWIAYGERLSRPYPPGMKVEDLTIPCPGGGHDGKIKVRIYRSAGERAGQPCVIFLHGGGFIKGDLDSGDTNAWGLADLSGAVVVSVDYRLAPEFPYPAALLDAYGVLDYLARDAAKLGIDRNRIAVWGESAGGNLATALSLLTRDRGGPQLAAQVLIYPCLTNDLSAESYKVYGESVGLKTSFCAEIWKAYLAGKSGEAAKYATPLTCADLTRLPPAFIHHAEIDPIADDSPQYAARLREAGVPVTLRCATGMIHGFVRARFSGSTAEREFALPCMFLRGIFAAAGIDSK